MGDKLPTFDFSKLNFDLSAGAGSGGFDFTSALAGLQSQLGNLVGDDSGYFATLPKSVQRRVRALRNLDRQYDDAEEEFERELKALELKYHTERFTPLFAKRAQIVSGKVEPTDEEAHEEDEEEEESEPKIQEIKQEKKEEDEEKKETPTEEENVVGIPEFWVTALNHHDLFTELITEKDEKALQFLVDITHNPVLTKSTVKEEKKEEDDEEEEGKEEEEDDAGSFSLEFHFSENPYFTNDVLRKTYHLEGDEGDEVICKSVESTEIIWKEGQDLTKGVKKGLGPDMTFFNFFCPPNITPGKEPLPDDLQTMELDFQMAVALKEEIIKHAVFWFTGEAALGQMYGAGDDDDEDDDEEGGEEDDDEDDDGEYVPPEGEAKPECKQQ